MTGLLRALSDSTRRQILTSLQAQSEPVTVDEVAAAHGIHRTVAFEHLELLAGLGLLVRASRTGFRGRPARTYRFAGEAAEVSYPPRQHRRLAGLLAESIASGTPPDRLGEAWGRRLAAGSPTASGAIARLEPLGADYRVVGDHIHARNCVFQDACVAARTQARTCSWRLPRSHSPAPLARRWARCTPRSTDRGEWRSGPLRR